MSVTENAFKGYGYQDYVYLLCVVLMDTRSDVVCIKAETGKDKHDFDDIHLVTEGNTKYFFQVKNYKKFKESLYEVTAESVMINGTKSFLKTGEKNIVILQNSSLENNDSIFGLPARKEGELYLVTLSADQIASFIDEQYVGNLERNIQICHFANKRIVEAQFYVEKKDLPVYDILSHELKEKTLEIRNESLNIEKGILYVVGKPGVGKSHFVNELESQLDNFILYRFWISSQDGMKSDRLKYNTFMQELRYKLYRDFRKVNDKDIIEELRKRDITLVIDGMDHVENYNREEIDKYFSFFELLEGIKVIILTRPLKHPIGNRVYYLQNWNASQTYFFLRKQFKIDNIEVSEQIYQMTDGYPILVNYSASYYNLYGVVQLTEKITEVEEYYKLLLKDVSFLDALSVFGITESFLTIKDIEVASNDEYVVSTVKDFITAYPFLFEQRFNRYSLLHDSFNTFFRNRIIEEERLASRQKKYIQNVEKDIDAGHLRFMNRVNMFKLSDSFKRNLLIQYADFKEMERLIEENFDIEAVVEFYGQLFNVLENQDESIFSVSQYYSFLLIQVTLQRAQLNGCVDVLAEQIDYMFHVEQTIFDEIYSDKLLFEIIENVFCIQNSKINIRKIAKEIQRTQGDENLYRFLEAMRKSRKYFEMEKQEWYKNIFLQEFWHKDRDKIYNEVTEALVYFYMKESDYQNIGKIIDNLLYQGLTDENYKELLSAFSQCYFSRETANNIIEFVRWRLYALGELKETNPYLCESLEKNIIDNSKKSWLDVNGVCQYYIQLAIYERRKIDIKSLNKFYVMFAGECDDSLTYLPDCLCVFEKHKLLTKKQSLQLISRVERLCYGNVSMIERYVNTEGELYFSQLLDLGILNKKYNLQILDLDKQIINRIPEEKVISALYEYMGIYEEIRTIEQSHLLNILNSKYAQKVLDILSKEGYHVININQQERKNSIGTSYKNRDCLLEEDLKDIIENNESHLLVAQYFDGWYRCFNNLEFFEHYDKEILKHDFQKILHLSMNAKKNIIERRGELICFLSNLPIFADMIGYENAWEEWYLILQHFIRISMI